MLRNMAQCNPGGIQRPDFRVGHFSKDLDLAGNQNVTTQSCEPSPLKRPLGKLFLGQVVKSPMENGTGEEQ